MNDTEASKFAPLLRRAMFARPSIPRARYSVVVLAIGLAGFFSYGCASNAGEDLGPDAIQSTTDTAQEIRANGQETGAFLRQTTPAGYTCIMTTVRAPGWSTDAIQPWVYFGFGDEHGIDSEVGLSYQHGNGSLEKPARYLPYLRLGKTLWYAGEKDRVLPNDQVVLRARLVGEKVYLNKDGQTVEFVSRVDEAGVTPIEPMTFLRVAGLTANNVHVRRVVGLALDTYDGRRLPTFGPVVFEQTRVCDPGGNEVSFTGVRASWSERRGITIYGTSATPANAVTRRVSGESESIQLF